MRETSSLRRRSANLGLLRWLRRRVYPHVAKLPDQVSGPAINVLFPYQLPHALHTLFSLFRIHNQRDANGLGRLVNVVGVHQQGIAQLTRGAGKAAQYQYSVFVATRCEKLFGNQIHAIVERGDQAQVSSTIETLDLLVAVLRISKDDGPPIGRLEAPVDAFGFEFNFHEQVVVPLDMRPAGRADFHKHELLYVRRVLLEEPLDGQETLEN